MAISWVLKPQHRSRVMFQRFMPWWNAQKRKELAEKKEEEHRKKAEESKQQVIILKEQQEKEAMLLEAQMHKKPEETKHLDENDDLGRKVEEKTHKDEKLLNKQKDSSKLQKNERDTNDCLVGKDLEDKNIPEENIEKLSIEKKKKDAEKIIYSEKQSDIKKVPSDNRRDASQVCGKQDLNQVDIQGTTMNHDDENAKIGMICVVKKQFETNKEDIQQKNTKQNTDDTKDDNDKKKCFNDIVIKIENNKDVCKFNKFKNNDIIKTHTDNQSNKKSITV